MALDVHIVSHTHWDREWYHPFERFRQRLVALIDDLIESPPAAGESFLLDGQAVLIDDYLGVRPDRADELGALLRDGRLEAGPWYVLADELIPSGEALVRNLLTGRRVLGRFGATAPPVLYCPDSFGHPAALPELAAGFGLPLTILWRGYGGPRWPTGDTVRWVSPGGASTLLFHLPRDGYEFGSSLPYDRAAATERWDRIRAELVPRSTTGVILVPNGADHHARQQRLGESLSVLESVGAGDGVRRSSLRRFAERLVERADAQRLPVVRGELRDSYGYTWALQGTFATRAHEKRLNARAERLLLREAEPWAALAGIKGSSRQSLVEVAWRDLLTAHPHDTLCGCSIDDVAVAMEVRIRSVVHQAAGIRDDSILDLIGHDAVQARMARDRWRPIVVVRNPAPRPRTGVAIVDVDEFLADVAVGPSSARVAPSTGAVPSTKPSIPALGTVQVLSQRVQHSRTESPQHYPDDDLVVSRRVAVWIGNVPAYGLTSHAIGEGEARRRSRPVNPVTVEANSLHHAKLRIAVDDAGVVSLETPDGERRIASLFEFVDDRDVGDLYTPAPRPRPFAVEFRGARRMHRGPLLGELALRYRVLDADTTRVIADLTVQLSLEADSPFVRVVVRGDNRGLDHRLRIAFHSDATDAVVWADAAFGPVRRDPLVLGNLDAGAEQPPPTAPLHRYVSLFNESLGFTVFSDGLGEYEARTDGQILVTLLRAVGELSRNDLPERPGHAGWPASTPGAQCLGPFEAAFAVMPHASRLVSTIDEIERVADDVLSPMTGVTVRSALSLPAPVEGVELVGAGLGLSAIKTSENGEWLVLRCVNVRDDEVAGSWRLPFDVGGAHLARLDETPMSELITNGSEIVFTAGARAIVTILARPALENSGSVA